MGTKWVWQAAPGTTGGYMVAVWEPDEPITSYAGGVPEPSPVTSDDVAPPSVTTTPPQSFNASSGDQAISVDSRALKYYAGLLRDLVEPVRQAQLKLESVKVAPGRFKAAASIKGKVDGGDAVGGVATQYAQELYKMQPALSDLADAMEELARNYDTSEELNSESAFNALNGALTDFAGNMPGGGAGV